MSTTTATSNPTGANTIYNPTVATNAAGSAPATAGSQTALGENSFLQLLVTQLQNQDPDNPMDDTAFVSQLAQFSSLQQMTNLNTTMTAQNALNSVSQGASMIGKTITSSSTDANGNAISGVVTSASVTNGDVSLNIGNTSIDLTTVTGVQ